MCGKFEQIMVLDQPLAALLSWLCLNGLPGQIEIASPNNVHAGWINE